MLQYCEARTDMRVPSFLEEVESLSFFYRKIKHEQSEILIGERQCLCQSETLVDLPIQPLAIFLVSIAQPWGCNRY